MLSGYFATSVPVTSFVAPTHWCQCPWICHRCDECSLSAEISPCWCRCRGQFSSPTLTGFPLTCKVGELDRSGKSLYFTWGQGRFCDSWFPVWTAGISLYCYCISTVEIAPNKLGHCFKTSLLHSDGSELLKGKRRQVFCRRIFIVNGWGISHLLVMGKLGKFQCYNEWELHQTNISEHFSHQHAVIGFLSKIWT